MTDLIQTLFSTTNPGFLVIIAGVLAFFVRGKIARAVVLKAHFRAFGGEAGWLLLDTNMPQ